MVIIRTGQRKGRRERKIIEEKESNVSDRKERTVGMRTIQDGGRREEKKDTMRKKQEERANICDRKKEDNGKENTTRGREERRKKKIRKNEDS